MQCFQIFQSLENPNEVETLETYKALLLSKRKIFLNSVWNVTSGQSSEDDLDSLLMEYEVVVEQAVDNGINIVSQDFHINWDYSQSIFFVITILTTIGYGHFAPVTVPGRVFCIFFAIIGIPFFLSVISDMGQIIATLMTTVWEKYKQKILPFIEKLKSKQKKKKPTQKDEE